MDTAAGAGQTAGEPGGPVFSMRESDSSLTPPPPANDGAFPAGPYSSDLDPGHDVVEPARLTSPLVFSSPHSGSFYPQDFLAAVALDPLTLRRSEDAFVDELFGAAAGVGAPLLRAHFPRAFLDVNREPYELDQRMFDERLPPYANTRSMRVAGGLGTIARVVGEAKEIYGRRISVAEALRRIETLYKPWHHRLRGLMRRAEETFGVAALIDCHSMPSSVTRGREDGTRADIVLGDRYGTSCDAALVETAEVELRRRGYNVTRNKPYAGGFITEHYGNPAMGWHALQIEVNRALYMDEKTLTRASGFEPLVADLSSMMTALAEVAQGSLSGRRAAAAE
jgi:N-formylglutamate amidohydrolase